MLLAAGTLGSPGMVMTSPVRTTLKPAPVRGRISRTCSVWPSGAPSSVGSSEKEYCVLEITTGMVSQPLSFRVCKSRSARLEYWTSCARYISLAMVRSEEHTSELQSRFDLVCRLLLEKK